MTAVHRRLPLIAFFAIYLPTCYVGAIVFLLPGMWIQPQLPELGRRDVLVVLILLNAAPALLFFGAEVGFRLVARLGPRRERPPASTPGIAGLGWAVFLAALAVAGWSLHRADAMSFLGGWANHGVYLEARWRLIARLTFWEFVNFYTVLPLAAAYLMVVHRRLWTRLLIALPVGLAQYPLAQRRVLLTSALLIGAALYVHAFVDAERARGGRTLRTLVGGVAALWVVFLVLTLQWGFVRTATHGLMRRYAVPAVAYPLVFPRVLPYYHLDLGLDMLGVGRMPDDNIRVQQVRSPGSRNTISAPFQFVLYSQGGVLVALAGAVVVGAALGAGWAAVLAVRRGTVTRSLLGALAITFGAFLAMDSPRNAATVSYGVGWGILVVALLHLAETGLTAWRTRE